MNAEHTDAKEMGNHLRELLPVEVRKANGAILYSSIDTLRRRGPFYLMGTNPGGDPDDREQQSKTIDAELDTFDSNTKNAYQDENWIDHSNDAENSGTALVQRRIQALASDILRVDLRSVCATNLIYGRSRSICKDFLSSESFWTHANYCWPAHLYLISLVNPDILLVFGNGPESPYAFIRWRYGLSETERDTEDSGYSNWKIKRLRNAHICGRNRTVIGVPHFAYFDPMKDPVRARLNEWIREGTC
ncbi:MAG: hypothetical protein HN341_05110 [Verrucomicrobia bacterium]|nr:hypothetical protein [Verrucomicrobiota bacterium]